MRTLAWLSLVCFVPTMGFACAPHDGDHDRRSPIPAPTSSGTSQAPTTGSNSSYGASSSGSVDDDPSGTASGSTSSSSSSSGITSSGGTAQGGGSAGQCVPNAVCNGIASCTDNCFGERCCSIGCSCNGTAGDPQARLACSMTCSGK